MIRMALLTAALAAAMPAAAQSLRAVEVVAGLNNPWAAVPLPGGDFLITQKNGEMHRLSGGTLGPALTGLRKVASGGQGSLFDIALHPDFAQNRRIYFSYAGPGRDGDAGTEVAFGTLGETGLTDVVVIYVVDPKTPGGAHYSGKLAFGPDGKLYITTGDRFDQRNQAQQMNSQLGKVIRLNEDGTSPKDNPFYGQPGQDPMIWTLGHRNQQGLAFRPGSGQLWQHEHGPRGGDEVNLIRKGENYGWPKVSYGINYDGTKVSDLQTAPDYVEPIVKWVPSIAPSGMAFYDGDRYPGWRGNLFVGALAGEHLRRLVLDGDRIVQQEELLQSLGERIRDVRQGEDGWLYVLTDGRNGRLLRLQLTQ